MEDEVKERLPSNDIYVMDVTLWNALHVREFLKKIVTSEGVTFDALYGATFEQYKISGYHIMSMLGNPDTLAELGVTAEDHVSMFKKAVATLDENRVYIATMNI